MKVSVARESEARQHCRVRSCFVFAGLSWAFSLNANETVIFELRGVGGGGGLG